MAALTFLGALALYLIGRAGDVAARWHRERDQWSAQ